MGIHLARAMFTSGQLLFLGKRGFIHEEWWRLGWDGLPGGFAANIGNICKKTNTVDRPSQGITSRAE
jgi:hypothetical protein